jgi:uncharacterized integral membrane protein
MKAMKLIIIFFIFMVFTYFGVLFVNLNKQEVVVKIFKYQSDPMSVGIVVLTSILFGMVACAALCGVELVTLYMQRSSLRKRLHSLMKQNDQSSKILSEIQP